MLPLLWIALQTPAHAGAAVLELYTSQGCSSCPPADALLNRLLAEAVKSGDAIFPLAFHVDYWNNLGWPDPFSSLAWSQRQQAWSAHMGVDRIYTPQLIVSGQAQLVGSDEAGARAAIAAALAKPDTVSLELASTESKAGLDVEVKVLGLHELALVQVALVEDGLVTAVPRGENAGRTLHHDHVVRALAQSTARAPGTVALHLTVPTDVNRSHASLVAWVSDAQRWEVLGAKASTLPVL